MYAESVHITWQIVLTNLQAVTGLRKSLLTKKVCNLPADSL